MNWVDRPDIQNAVRRLMRPDDMLETFSELAVKEPDLMRLVSQASVVRIPSRFDERCPDWVLTEIFKYDSGLHNELSKAQTVPRQRLQFDHKRAVKTLRA